MNWFKLYVGDYQRDTGALSLTEHGVYFVMLQHHYATEKPLPKGKDLYRLLRCESKADRDAVDSITAKFWQESEAGWSNVRAAEEMGKAGAQAETNRLIALAREEARRVERIEHESCTNRAPNQIPEPDKSKPPEADASLEAIWNEGVELLRGSQLKESTARSFIGMLLRQHYPEDVVGAIQAAAGTVNPKAYITTILKTKPLKGAASSRATFD